MSSIGDTEIPQWKKDLIARLRNQNKRTATAAGRQLPGPPPVRAVQQPGSSEAVVNSRECAEPCKGAKMVQERAWEYTLEAGGPCDNGDCSKSDSDSSEDLRYGPGIVNKLRNKYLSLAQREAAPRAPVLMRKAASLEHMLEDAAPGANRPPQRPVSYESAKSAPHRYRNAARGSDLKRARSVEAISRSGEHEPEASREREEMLIAEGSDDPQSVPDKKMLEMPEKPYSHRVNRPKRIAPIMNEKEKPPADVVKQAKLIFERRTKPPQQTGDVAAKVATYKNIIGQAKAKKPPIKVKPTTLADKPKSNGIRRSKPVQVDKPKDKEPDTGPRSPLPSPIPDVSRIDKTPGDESSPKTTGLSETPDLIMTSSPLPAVNSPSFRISVTENFIKEERRLSTSLSPIAAEAANHADETGKKIANTSNSMTFNFANKSQTNRNVLNTHTPPLPPLKLEINGVGNVETKKSSVSPVKSSASPIRSPVSPVRSPVSPTLKSPVLAVKPNLTILEIEKNLINTAKTLEQPKSVSITTSTDGVTKIKVPKVKKPPRELENNSIVFKFTDRKDVPDYVHNDGITRVAKIEKPKVGEGGIILLPGASIDESFTDEDEEIMRSLEGPPSPCDVTFINDNILIDGKSSLNQKTKKAKMKISFVEEGPEIYEYPSETSLLIEDVTSPLNAQVRPSVPSVTGSSSLGSYTPKSTEEFQPGVTRSLQNIPKAENSESIDSSNELILQEVEKPVLFSAGANTDILF